MAIKSSSDGEGPRSISGSGLSVARSAFNPVKVEATLIVLGAIAVAALSERLIGGGLSFVLLLAYGMTAGGWITLRSRRVLTGHAGANAQHAAAEVVPDGQE